MISRRILPAVLPLIMAALLLPTLLCAQGRAQTDERILDFRSHIRIHEDGTMTVTETIRVNAMGWEIKRGIYRDLLTRYEDNWGNDFRVDYEFTQVLRNGQPEPWHTADQGDSVRLYIGESSVYIPQGQHTYTITYVTDRQIGYFDNYDEIYWNVTGSNWSFPIDRAEAVIQLPPGTEPTQWAAYTGAWGDAGQDFRQDLDPEGNIRFTTTRPLYAREGLTVAVAWPKGVVAEPTRGERFGYLLSDNLYLVVALAGVLLLWCIQLTAWFFVGRDPAKGVIVPRFSPPPNMSPAEVRYVRRMGFDNKCFAAALVNMAVKGQINIVEKTKGSYTVERDNRPGPDLSPDEIVALDKLLGSRKSLRLKNTNHTRIRGAINELRMAVRKSSLGSLFFSNSIWMVWSFLIALITFIVSAFFLHEGVIQAIVAVFFSGWTGVGLFLAYNWFKNVTAIKYGTSGTALQTWVSFFFAILLLGLAAIFLVVIVFGNHYAAPFTFLPLVMGFTLILFRYLIKAPTKLGRQIMDQIEGFRMYLETAEHQDLALRNPPERTPELFEKYLPYALAMDVEVGWTEQFSNVLNAATTDDDVYQPIWYRGNHWQHLGVMGAASALGASLNSAVTSSSAAPSSSSGSGGGGFSGGGGGGGGGGGW